MTEPTVWTKRTMGALMGGGVGLTIGFLFGSWSIMQHGAGPRGVLSTLSKTMLSSAATFSFFLAIGSVIRNDALEGAHLQTQMMVPASAIRSRAEGFQLMRARWEEERRRGSSSRP
ncbi:reactive mitochondrial oxygen species modulator 1-domain-containing protein [Mycena galopus ATCC 62051]|nr:reactive mitochondrial oxygen species modulator 1-domain-containing protein [Mycena galopus ATCC 62051]